jgi:hypothetical protein
MRIEIARGLIPKMRARILITLLTSYGYLAISEQRLSMIDHGKVRDELNTHLISLTMRGA